MSSPWEAELTEETLVITGPGEFDVIIHNFHSKDCWEERQSIKDQITRSLKYLIDSNGPVEMGNLLRVTSFEGEDYRTSMFRCGHAAWQVPNEVADGIWLVMTGRINNYTEITPS